MKGTSVENNLVSIDKLKKRRSAMKSQIFTVERIDVDSKKSFEELRAEFEKRVPALDPSLFPQLAASRASAVEIEARVQSSAGDLEFMQLGRIDQGTITSLLGKPKKMTTYLLGNPVLANRMFEQN